MMLEDYKGYCPKCGNEKRLATKVCVANEFMATIAFKCRCGNEWCVNYYGPPQTLIEEV